MIIDIILIKPLDIVFNILSGHETILQIPPSDGIKLRILWAKVIPALNILKADILLYHIWWNGFDNFIQVAILVALRVAGAVVGESLPGVELRLIVLGCVQVTVLVVVRIGLTGRGFKCN